jgi:serine/threonine protein kinase
MRGVLVGVVTFVAYTAFFITTSSILQEAKFLASLSHPNIIKLRGMAAAGTSGFASMEERGYFLLLDRLQCTLEHKIEHWKNFGKAIITQGDKRGRQLLAERVHVAFDVAAALSYLHVNHVIYRDLKPDNIGFDIRGTCQLYSCERLYLGGYMKLKQVSKSNYTFGF